MAKRRKNPASPTDTPAFKAWFGNSVVVDEAGVPLVCFHGTKRGGFDTFDKREIDKHHAGFFFTTDEDMAASYTDGKGRHGPDPVPPEYSTPEEMFEAVNVYRDETGGGIHVAGPMTQSYESRARDRDKNSDIDLEFWFLVEEDVEDREVPVRHYYKSFEDLEEVWPDFTLEETMEVVRILQNEQLMTEVEVIAWGASSREPTPRHYDFTELLKEVNAIVQGKDTGIYRVYLRIENPLVVDAKGANWAAIPFNYNMGWIKEEDLPKTVAELTQFLKSPQNDFESPNGQLSLHLRVKGVREEDDDGNPYVVQQYTLRWHNRDTNDFSYVDDERNPWWYTDPAELLAVAREAIYNGGRTDGSSTDGICDEAVERGHDGCIIKNVQDYGGGGEGSGGDVYVVFSPNQVKSASVNNGNYSRTDNDIRHNPSLSHEDDPAHVPDASGWLSISECAHALHRNPAARRPAHVRGEGAHTDAKALTAAVNGLIAKFNSSPAAMSIPAESPLFFEGLPPVVVKFTAGRANAVGVCLYNMRTGACVIQLHGGVWEDFTEDERLETVLHETAHAIDFQRFAHRNSKHGERWKFIAKALGGKALVSTDEAESAKMNAWRRRKQGLPPAISTESIEQLGLTFDVGQFVTFPFKRKVLTGCIVGRAAATHAKVRVYEDGVDAGVSISVPYDHLTRVKAPKVPGVDKPFPGESLSAWQDRTDEEAMRREQARDADELQRWR